MKELKIVVVNPPDENHQKDLLKEITEFIQENYYQKEVKKMKKRVKVNLFNILVLITSIISSYFIVHDFTILGIIPLFTKNLVSLTYTGAIIDICAVFMLDASIQIIEGWFK